MSAFLDKILAERPELDPETPFAEILDAISDAVVAMAKVADLTEVDPAELRREFPLRTSEEQTAFGVKVAVASLTLQALSSTLADSVGAVFEDYRDEHAPAEAAA